MKKILFVMNLVINTISAQWIVNDDYQVGRKYYFNDNMAGVLINGSIPEPNNFNEYLYSSFNRVRSNLDQGASIYVKRYQASNPGSTFSQKVDWIGKYDLLNAGTKAYFFTNCAQDKDLFLGCGSEYDLSSGDEKGFAFLMDNGGPSPNLGLFLNNSSFGPLDYSRLYDIAGNSVNSNEFFAVGNRSKIPGNLNTISEIGFFTHSDITSLGLGNTIAFEFSSIPNINETHFSRIIDVGQYVFGIGTIHGSGINGTGFSGIVFKYTKSPNVNTPPLNLEYKLFNSSKTSEGIEFRDIKYDELTQSLFILYDETHFQTFGGIINVDLNLNFISEIAPNFGNLTYGSCDYSFNNKTHSLTLSRNQINGTNDLNFLISGYRKGTTKNGFSCNVHPFALEFLNNLTVNPKYILYPGPLTQNYTQGLMPTSLPFRLQENLTMFGGVHPYSPKMHRKIEFQSAINNVNIEMSTMHDLAGPVEIRNKHFDEIELNSYSIESSSVINSEVCKHPTIDGVYEPYIDLISQIFTLPSVNTYYYLSTANMALSQDEVEWLPMCITHDQKRSEIKELEVISEKIRNFDFKNGIVKMYNVLGAQICEIKNREDLEFSALGLNNIYIIQFESREKGSEFLKFIAK